MAFAGAFLASATAVFALAWLLGAGLQISRIPVELRRGLAAAGLTALACVDLLAIRACTYCPVGWRRQTPKTLSNRHSAVLTTMVWGLDTGLAFTTFRVGAVTWGAFILALLGLSGWQIGIGYGLGFVIPLLLLLWSPRPVEWRFLKKLLAMRPIVQLVSAVLLLSAALVVVLQSTVNW